MQKRLNVVAKRLKGLFAISLIFLLPSCGNVTIRNTEWCGDLGIAGASCVNTGSQEVRRIDFDQWNQERYGMMCTKAENFAHWKEVILQLCKAYKKCSFEERNQIVRFNNKIIRFKNEYKRERDKLSITEPMQCR